MPKASLIVQLPSTKNRSDLRCGQSRWRDAPPNPRILDGGRVDVMSVSRRVRKPSQTDSEFILAIRRTPGHLNVRRERSVAVLSPFFCGFFAVAVFADACLAAARLRRPSFLGGGDYPLHALFADPAFRFGGFRRHWR